MTARRPPGGNAAAWFYIQSKNHQKNLWNRSWYNTPTYATEKLTSHHLCRLSALHSLWTQSCTGHVECSNNSVTEIMNVGVEATVGYRPSDPRVRFASTSSNKCQHHKFNQYAAIAWLKCSDFCLCIYYVNLFYLRLDNNSLCCNWMQKPTHPACG